MKHPFIDASGTHKCACCGGENNLTFQPLRLPNPWAYECDSDKCNQDQQEIAKRVRKYGVTYNTYAEIHEYQGGRCPICTEPIGKFREGIVIDHDHSCCPPGRKACGRCVRGILHRNCNLAIGFLRDNADSAERAADYLREEFPWR
ncbi:endonuclease VII domain-containing protein [Streptomyces sp. NPDC052051]|uniref:endonuclease VII domain-containing protein n=1 Tax=Streptomyces sp. NPDC052051 TaxID=3154649 RepID=UPI0034193318